MEQEIGSEAQGDPAAAAFEALRREVALLNVAVAGLAAERVSAPDYSETLGELSKGVTVAVGRLGKVLTSPALALSPAEVARQIAAAGDEARRQDRAALTQAQEGLRRATGDLDGWIDRARLASAQNWRLLQVALAGLLVGAILGVLLPGVVARAAPERWAWPERMAAHVLRRDLWSAGERLLQTADAGRWAMGGWSRWGDHRGSEPRQASQVLARGEASETSTHLSRRARNLESLPSPAGSPPPGSDELSNPGQTSSGTRCFHYADGSSEPILSTSEASDGLGPSSRAASREAPMELGQDILRATADIVSAYVSNHSVKPEMLAGVISSVGRALAELTMPRDGPSAPALVAKYQPEPAAYGNLGTPARTKGDAPKDNDPLDVAVPPSAERFARERPATKPQARRRRDEQPIVVTDNWPGMIPITPQEVRIFEAFMGDKLDEMLGAAPSSGAVSPIASGGADATDCSRPALDGDREAKSSRKEKAAKNKTPQRTTSDKLTLVIAETPRTPKEAREAEERFNAVVMDLARLLGRQIAREAAGARANPAADEL